MTEFHVTSASRLLHQPVHNLHGRPLGEIEELVIDSARGFIAYVVLTHIDPAAPIERKRFVIPWGAFRMGAAHEGPLQLNMEPEALNASPGCSEMSESASLPASTPTNARLLE